MFFNCEYNRHKEFDRVTMTSDKRSEEITESDRVSVDAMSKFCKGMASEKFGESPRYIVTGRPMQRNNGIYLVTGQYNLTPSTVQVFTCKFTESGKFMHVHKSNR